MCWANGAPQMNETSCLEVAQTSSLLPQGLDCAVDCHLPLVGEHIKAQLTLYIMQMGQDELCCGELELGALQVFAKVTIQPPCAVQIHGVLYQFVFLHEPPWCTCLESLPLVYWLVRGCDVNTYQITVGPCYAETCITTRNLLYLLVQYPSLSPPSFYLSPVATWEHIKGGVFNIQIFVQSSAVSVCLFIKLCSLKALNTSAHGSSYSYALYNSNQVCFHKRLRQKSPFKLQIYIFILSV